MPLMTLWRAAMAAALLAAAAAGAAAAGVGASYGQAAAGSSLRVEFFGPAPAVSADGRVEHAVERVTSTGRVAHLSYEAHRTRPLVALDALQDVVAHVECSSNATLRLDLFPNRTLDDLPEALTRTASGDAGAELTVVTGGLLWQCESRERPGRVGAVLREVARGARARVLGGGASPAGGPSVELEASPVAPSAVLREARVRLHTNDFGGAANSRPSDGDPDDDGDDLDAAAGDAGRRPGALGFWGALESLGDDIVDGVDDVLDLGKDVVDTVGEVAHFAATGELDLDKGLEESFQWNFEPSHRYSAAKPVLGFATKGSATVACTQCFLDLDVTAHFDMQISGYDDVDYVAAAVQGQLRGSLGAAVKASGSATMDLDERTIFETSLGSITVFIAEVPVVISFDFNVVLGGGVTVEADATVVGGLDLTPQSVAYGFGYGSRLPPSGPWAQQPMQQHIWGAPSGGGSGWFHLHAPLTMSNSDASVAVPQASAELDLDLGFKFHITAHVEGVLVGSLEPEPHLITKARVDYSGGPATGGAAVEGYVAFGITAGVDVSIAGHDLFHRSKTWPVFKSSTYSLYSHSWNGGAVPQALPAPAVRRRVAAAAAAAAAGPGDACDATAADDDSQCGVRGVCLPSGVCACHRGWGGPECLSAVHTDSHAPCDGDGSRVLRAEELDVCSHLAGRTVCGAGAGRPRNATRVDEGVRGLVRKLGAARGPTCSEAMAALQCRMALPLRSDASPGGPTTPRVCFADCVLVYRFCGFTRGRSHAMCRHASSSLASPVAPESSPDDCESLPGLAQTRYSHEDMLSANSTSVVDAAAFRASNETCQVAEGLEACPDLNGHAVYVSTALLGRGATPRDADALVAAKVASLEDVDDDCAEAARRLQCALMLPACHGGERVRMCSGMCEDLLRVCPARVGSAACDRFDLPGVAATVAPRWQAACGHKHLVAGYETHRDGGDGSGSTGHGGVSAGATAAIAVAAAVAGAALTAALFLTAAKRRPRDDAPNASYTELSG